MSNTSATGGILAPTNHPTLPDDQERLIRQAVAGITGLSGNLVRPRWQPKPAPQPSPETNWCSIGVAASRDQGEPATIHDPTGEGSDVVVNWRRLRLLCSFYGPGGHGLAEQLGAGLNIGQNRSLLRGGGLALVDVGERVSAPELINSTWIRRVDLELIFDVEEQRTYPVLNLVGASAELSSDTGQTRDITIQEE